MTIDQQESRSVFCVEVQHMRACSERLFSAQRAWLFAVLGELEWLGAQPGTEFVPGEFKRQKDFLETSYQTQESLHKIGCCSDLDQYYRKGAVSALCWQIVTHRDRLELLFLLDNVDHRFMRDPQFAKWYANEEVPCFNGSITNGCVVVRPSDYRMGANFTPSLIPIALLGDFWRFYLR